jgi:hypothetical protein
MFGYFLPNTGEMLQYATVLHSNFVGTNFGQLNMALLAWAEQQRGPDLTPGLAKKKYIVVVTVGAVD